jgi:homoserine kinase type II
MSVYTRVTPEELSSWLERHPAGALRELHGIREGIENTNYRVETTKGSFVLTLFERIPATELPFYLDLMTHLAGQGFPCPRPVPDDGGATLGKLNGKPAALASFMPGKPILEPDPAHCASVGAMLADLHGLGASFGRSLHNPRGSHWWKETAAQLLPGLSAQDAALLREELRFQSLYRFPELARGIIHADLFRDNVLWSDDRISGVIDFYFAATDVLLYDVAIAANDWCVAADGGLDPGRTQALLAGYHARRPLTAIERGAWPVLLRAGALRFWLSRLHDFHAPRSGDLTHAKDPNHFRDILQRRVADHARLSRTWVQDPAHEGHNQES